MIQPIGSRRCEIALVNLLNERQNSVLTNKVTKAYHIFKRGIKELGNLSEFRVRMMSLLKDATLQELGNRGFPLDVEQHLRCVIIAIFRDALKKGKT